MRGKSKVIFLALLVLILSACQPALIEPTPTPTPEIVLSPTATSTPTPIPTNTAIPTATPYQTPLPLSDDEAAAYLQELYETNGGCELPCWWGITAGETTFHEALDLLLPKGNIFSDSSVYKTERVYGINISTPPDFGYFPFAVVYLFTPIDPSDPYYGIVTGLSVADTFSIPYNDYALADYLGLLGEPDQIYISPFYDGVFFYLFYLDEGITIYNQQIRNELNKTLNFVACPQSEIADRWHWSAWNPNTANLLEEMIAGAGSGGHYVPFEEVTDITIHEFYEIYLDPDTSYCIEGEVVIDADN